MGRSASLSRTTKETSIEVALDLDGTGRADVQTPLPFLTHMVEQIARHGLIDLTVRAKGDVRSTGTTRRKTWLSFSGSASPNRWGPR